VKIQSIEITPSESIKAKTGCEFATLTVTDTNGSQCLNIWPGVTANGKTTLQLNSATIDLRD